MQSNASFTEIDPAWAWSEWQPSADEPWDAARAAHLFRRAGFGADAQALNEAIAGSLPQTLDRLLDVHRNDTDFRSASEQLAQSALASGQSKPLAVWWLHEMLHTRTPLVEKMTLFWHGHFATGADKVKQPQVMLQQNRLLREHALGSVASLVHGISKDAAMLVYLDSAVNRKAHPNENFARELMELFCLGEGNYSERDVQELARCFTGWEVRRDLFRFNSFQHDSGKKSLLGRQDIESGEEAVDAVLASPHAARFIAGKLFRFFIADEPAAPARLIEPLAEQLMADKWHVAGTVRRLLGSRLMFSAAVRGRKIRSPIEWALNWMKAGRISTNLNRVSDALSDLGQSLFYPPNVKGWDGGRAWINSSTLVGRTNLISRILRDETTRWDGQSLEEFQRSARLQTCDHLIDWLQRHLLCDTLASERRKRLMLGMELAGGIQRLADCIVLAAAMPEMQLA